MGHMLPRPAPRHRRRSTIRSLGAELGKASGGIVVVVALLIAWQALAMFGGFSEQLFPSVPRTFGRLWEMVLSGALIEAIKATMGRLLLGYCAALLIAIPTGLLMGRSQVGEDLVAPIVLFLMPIPALALVPLFVLWFGLGPGVAVALIVLTASIPMIVNTWTGVKNVQPILPLVAKSMNVSGAKLYLQVIVPSALPAILTGMRMGYGMSWRAAIGAELFAVSSEGLGIMLFEAKDFVRTDTIISVLIVVVTMSVVVERIIFDNIEARTVARWGMWA